MCTLDPVRIQEHTPIRIFNSCRATSSIEHSQCIVEIVLCDLKRNSTITRISRVRSFCFLLDNGSLFLGSFVPSSLPSEIPAPCSPSPSSFPYSRPYSRFPSFSLLSRFTHSTGHTVQRDSIFTEFSCMDYSASFVRTLSTSTSASVSFRSRRNFLVIVVRHAHNIDPRYRTFLFHSGQYVPLPAALCSTRDSCHDRSRRIHSGNVSKPFSFIYNLCLRFHKILAQICDRGNVARGKPDAQARHVFSV